MSEVRLIDANALKKAIIKRLGIKSEEFLLASERTIYDEIDNAPAVEPEKVLVANVTFDKDQLEQIIRDRVIEPIKNGELVLQTDKRPQGEWIRISAKAYKCKDCNYVTDIEYPYCPICGTRIG